MSDMYIKTSKDAKLCVGQMVYWDEHGRGTIILRCGVLDRVDKGKNIVLDGVYKWRPDLLHLRNFKQGGDFEHDVKPLFEPRWSPQ